MAISIQVNGMQKVENLFRNLPTNLQKEISKDSMTFMKRVRKSAKLRAPRDTGRLAESIILKRKGEKEIILEVQSPHGIFQEKGFTPHWIHSDMIRGSEKLTLKGFYFVKKSTPFVQPALEHNIATLPALLLQGTKKAINASVK